MTHLIEIRRDGAAPRRIEAVALDPETLQDGDGLAVVASPGSAPLPVTWGDTIVPLAPGRSIRVPSVWRWAEFRGFRLPNHLVTLTGAGPETLDLIGGAHIRNYERTIGLFPDMHFLDIGCGIGRDAFQLMDRLSPAGRYTGVDVTCDSIDWCRRHLTAADARLQFHHVDAYSELYNPFGRFGTAQIRLPVEDASVDRIGLASVFTHLLEDEVLHYLKEFRRVLKPDGLVHASFFLYTPEAIASARSAGTTQWAATFSQQLSPGVYANDPTYPRGAVAYTHETLQRLMREAGMVSDRPYVKGAWSGVHGDAAEEGQDAVILRRG